MEAVTNTSGRNPLSLDSLFITNAISLVGKLCTTIVIPWFVLLTSGSTGFFTILPCLSGWLDFSAGDDVGRPSYRECRGFCMLIGLGIIYFLTFLSMAFIPAMKEMNRKPQASNLS